MDSSFNFIDVVAAFTQNQKNTQLLKSAEAGDVNKVGVLLQAGAAIEATDRRGYTALIKAAYDGHSAVVTQLIEAKANIEATDRRGNTALMWATDNGHISVVKRLIAAGANIEAADKHGETALDSAAISNYKHAGFLLLNALSSERVEVLSREPDLASLIQSFRRTIARAKIDAIQTYMALFSHKEQQRIPLELMNPILAFKFPTWLSSREDLKIEEIPALKRLLDKMPKAVISAAAEEPYLISKSA